MVCNKTYSRVASSNTSCFKPHPGFYRLLMKAIFDAYVLWPFDNFFVTPINTRDFTVSIYGFSYVDCRAWILPQQIPSNPSSAQSFWLSHSLILSLLSCGKPKVIPVIIESSNNLWKTCSAPETTLGVVHKLCLQEKVGSKSKNVNFYKVETVNLGGRWSKKAKNLST